MTLLSWNVPGTRYYEAGVDRGVIFVNNIGIAWSGLVSIAEAASGGEPTPYYIDGYKYINLAAAEEYEATLEAVSSPDGFAVCDGMVEVYAGLFATQQRRVPFNLSYRTMVGNELDNDAGYKIHLVYNALAAPSQRKHATMQDRSEPVMMSWAITSTPPADLGIKPTAHFVVDSRKTNPLVLIDFEELLYGTEVSDPTFPTPAELFAIFS